MALIWIAVDGIEGYKRLRKIGSKYPSLPESMRQHIRVLAIGISHGTLCAFLYFGGFFK